MSANDQADLLLKDEVYRVVGAAFAVHNSIGHGLHEKPYENGLVVEFRALGIPYEQQRRFSVLHREVEVGEYIPDLIAFGSVVVDTKVIDRVTQHELGQMLNYLRISRLKVGVIFNFKHAKLEWQRVVLSGNWR